MQIVIDIPEEEYKIIKNCTAPMTWVEHLIKDGTPLPKGHGDLIDKNEYMKLLEDRVQDLNNKDILRKHDKIHGISIAYNICARTSAIIPAERSDNK